MVALVDAELGEEEEEEAEVFPVVWRVAHLVVVANGQQVVYVHLVLVQVAQPIVELPEPLLLRAVEDVAPEIQAQVVLYPPFIMVVAEGQEADMAHLVLTEMEPHAELCFQPGGALETEALQERPSTGMVADAALLI